VGALRGPSPSPSPELGRGCHELCLAGARQKGVCCPVWAFPALSWCWCHRHAVLGAGRGQLGHCPRHGGGCCGGVPRELPLGAAGGEHPCPALARLGGPCHPSQGTAAAAPSMGCAGPPHSPGTHSVLRCGEGSAAVPPGLAAPIAPQPWALLPPSLSPGLGVPSWRGSPAEDAQHPARLRLRWHLPFIGCGGSRGRGGGPTLPRGGPGGCWDGWDAGRGVGAACPGDGAAVPALPGRLSPRPRCLRPPSASPESPILPRLILPGAQRPPPRTSAEGGFPNPTALLQPWGGGGCVSPPPREPWGWTHSLAAGSRRGGIVPSMHGVPKGGQVNQRGGRLGTGSCGPPGRGRGGDDSGHTGLGWGWGCRGSAGRQRGDRGAARPTPGSTGPRPPPSRRWGLRPTASSP